MANEKKRVVILGCGFGGLETAIQLRNYCAKKVDITVIDQHEFFTFIPSIYKVAADTEDEENIVFPLERIFEKRGIKFVKDIVEAIDPKGKTVKLAYHQLIEYDYLVIALGSNTNYFGVKGAQENSLELKTIEHAVKIRETINDAVMTLTKPGPKPTKLNIAVMGGGLSGVETVCELRDYVHKLCSEYGIHEDRVSLCIVEAGPHLLGHFGERVYVPTEKRMQDLGITVHTTTMVKEVTKSALIAKDKKIPYDILLWVGGIKPHEITEDVKGMTCGMRGLNVNDQMQFFNDPSIFGAGDEIVCDGIVRTAQNAILEGGHVAKNLSRLMDGKPLLPYKKKKNMPLLVAMGKGYGLLAKGNLVLKGRLMDLLKRSIEWHYVWTRRGW